MLWLLLIVGLIGLGLVCRFGILVFKETEHRGVRLIVGWFRFRLPKGVPSLLERKKPARKEKTQAERTAAALDASQILLTELVIDDLRRLWRAIVRVGRIFKVRVHHCELIVATPDPSVTGIAYGCLRAASGILPPIPNLQVWPDFTLNKPEVRYRVEFSFRLINLLYGFATALVSLPIRKFFKISRSIRGTYRRR